MRLWTDIIDPAQASSFVRRDLSEYEAAKGTLARFLPNRQTADISVRFLAGQAGLVEEARYRAFDAEPEFGKQPRGKRITIDLPALSQQGIISERDQLRLRNASDDVRERILLDSLRNAVRGVADRVERQRGQVLVTGQATIDQDNYADVANYGRDAAFSVTAPTLWSSPTADRLAHLETWVDYYQAQNGDAPGVILAGRRVARALANGEQFATQLINGGQRRATLGDVQAFLGAAGMPTVEIYDRSTSAGRVIPDDVLILLPAAVETDGENELGATFWGQTLAASEPSWEIAESEQPGIVAAAFTNEGIPPIRHTFVDSISLPVLGNANLAMVAKVL